MLGRAAGVRKEPFSVQGTARYLGLLHLAQPPDRRVLTALRIHL